jgi:hypothetical protein
LDLSIPIHCEIYKVLKICEEEDFLYKERKKTRSIYFSQKHSNTNKQHKQMGRWTKQAKTSTTEGAKAQKTKNIKPNDWGKKPKTNVSERKTKKGDDKPPKHLQNTNVP